MRWRCWNDQQLKGTKDIIDRQRVPARSSACNIAAKEGEAKRREEKASINKIYRHKSDTCARVRVQGISLLRWQIPARGKRGEKSGGKSRRHSWKQMQSGRGRAISIQRGRPICRREQKASSFVVWHGVLQQRSRSACPPLEGGGGDGNFKNASSDFLHAILTNGEGISLRGGWPPIWESYSRVNRLLGLRDQGQFDQRFAG